MFSFIFVILLLSQTVSSQMNGEFWWLNEKFAKLQQVEPPPPKFGDVNEFETDDSVKVIFRDNELTSREINDYEESEIISLNEGEKLSAIYFQDQSELSKPTFVERDVSFFNAKNTLNVTEVPNLTESNTVKSIYKKEIYSPKNKSQGDGDELVFVFPESNEVLWNVNHRNVNKSSFPKDTNVTNNKNEVTTSTISNNKVWFEEDSKQLESESICTFIYKQECVHKNGIIHTPGSCTRHSTSNTQKICCILPLKSSVSSKLRQPKNYYKLIKRNKRSNSDEKGNAALKQRDALLERNFNLKVQTSKLTATTMRSKPNHKIVTPEYVDPYWNVKNTKFRNPELQSNTYTDYQNTKYDYGNQDYEDDYAVELPKPGLVGLYSDREDSRGQTSWKSKNTNKGFQYGDTDEVSEEGDDDGEVLFGYSTFDPRLGNRASTISPKPSKRKPQRLMTTTRDDDGMKSSGSQTISFHSTPDFHVLQGFKLVNLAGTRNRYVRKTTTERFYENDEDTTLDAPHTVTIISNEDYIDGIDLNQQVYKKCGKVTKKSASDTKFGKDVAESGCDPWLAFVVLTKSRQSILCYATIVHPRAAVTAADCVHGKVPGEITIISGVWDLKAEGEDSQSRQPTVSTHSQFKPGDLANDLAILHWKRPLSLDPNVQPACLADPHVGDDCYFVGWSGYDQALQPHPRWQQATILTPRKCNEKVSAPDVDLPAGAFCASVETRGTVTGIGGPLLCKTGGRVSIVGVAVYRENIVVLLPAFDWIITALREIRINEI